MELTLTGNHLETSEQGTLGNAEIFFTAPDLTFTFSEESELFETLGDRDALLGESGDGDLVQNNNFLGSDGGDSLIEFNSAFDNGTIFMGNLSQNVGLIESGVGGQDFEAIFPNEGIGGNVLPHDILDFGFISESGNVTQDTVIAGGVGKGLKVLKSVLEFTKFVSEAVKGSESKVTDLVKRNYGLLVEIKATLKDGLEQVNARLDQILDRLPEIAAQIDTNLISEVVTGAFNIFDLIVEYSGDPNQLQEIRSEGVRLMNRALAVAENVSEDAPAEFIAGHVAPSLMLATAARIASVIYASDEGLGQSTVQNDLNAAHSLLRSIFSENGALGEQIRDEIEWEEFGIYGTNGSHVFEFVIAGTVTGPGGTVIHNVAAHEGYQEGQRLGDSLFFPNHYERYGSINGLDADDADNPIPLAELLAELSPLTVDHVVPFEGDRRELNSARDWVEGQNSTAVDTVVRQDLLGFGIDDVLNFVSDLPSTAGLNEGDAGGNGDDHIVGFEGNAEFFLPSPDLIRGGGGNDTLEGLGERDALFGESGFDSLLGGDDDDKLFGGSGNDSLYGGEGDDKLEGNSGRDLLEGGNGNDILFQSEQGNFFGHDDPDNFYQVADTGGHLNGEGGNDLLVGNDGNDVILGGTGYDTVYGYGGDDNIESGPGNDSIFAGNGADTVFGDSGNDTIEGGAGNDEIDGSFGDDIITGGGGNDTITGGYGIDIVVYHGSKNDYIWTQASNGTWTVVDTRNNPVDGVDTLLSGNLIQSGYGVEFLQFDDGLVRLTTPPSGLSDGPIFTTQSNPADRVNDTSFDNIMVAQPGYGAETLQVDHGLMELTPAPSSGLDVLALAIPIV